METTRQRQGGQAGEPRDSAVSYRELFDNMLEGFACCRIIFDATGRASDFVYLHVNQQFASQTGCGEVIGRRGSEHGGGILNLAPTFMENYHRVATTGVPERFETFIPAGEKWFSIAVYRTRQGEFIAGFDDITPRKRAEKAFREAARRLRQAPGSQYLSS